MIDLSGSVTDCTQIKSIEFREGLSQATATCEVVCADTDLSIGDLVTVVIQGETVMTDGVVRQIVQRVPQYDYVVSIQDKLCLAVDYFIVPDNPASPYLATNIKAEDLVEDMLEAAGLTLADKGTTIFTYGTAEPVPIKLVSAWNMIETIGRVTGFTTYADAAGDIHFVERKTYVTASDTVSIHSFTTGSGGDILDIEYERSTKNLINRVVVYGGVSNEISYTAQASSPYLPAGFYKSMVVAHPLIDNLPAATATADVNLEMFNRLTETVSLKSTGYPEHRARQIVDITESFTGLTSSTLWLIFDVRHTLSAGGLESNYTLVR